MLSYTDIWHLVNRWGIRMRVTRRRNLALLFHGILRSRSGCLSSTVRSWSIGPTRHIHRLKRLHRFLKNSVVPVLPVFKAMAAVIRPHRPGGRRTTCLPIAIDWTKVHAFHVVFAAVPRRKRALPLAFDVHHPSRLRHSQSKLERGLCTLVAGLLPKDATPLILADAGFGQTEFTTPRSGADISGLPCGSKVGRRQKTGPLDNRKRVRLAATADAWLPMPPSVDRCRRLQLPRVAHHPSPCENQTLLVLGTHCWAAPHADSLLLP